MKFKDIKQKNSETVLGKKNYILLIIGCLLITTGYILMSGQGSTLSAYNPEIFNKLRIGVAPILCLTGYLINVIGIIAYGSTHH